MGGNYAQSTDGSSARTPHAPESLRGERDNMAGRSLTVLGVNSAEKILDFNPGASTFNYMLGNVLLVF